MDERTTQELISDLSDPDYNIRWNAADQLSKRAFDEAAIPLLVHALEQTMDSWLDAAEQVNDRWGTIYRIDPRKEVLSVFHQLHDPATMPALLKMLRRLSFAQIFINAARLGIESIGAPALPYLLSALKDPDPRGRDEILRALALLGDIKGLAALITEVGPAKAASLLQTTLDLRMVPEDEPSIRSFQKMGWPAVQYFLELLRSTDASVRDVAVKIISHVRDCRATPYLLATLRTELDKNVQEHIIWGLQPLVDPTTIYVLIAELEGHHYHPAQMALIAIGIRARDVLLAAKPRVRPEARERIDYVLEHLD
jgi:HEAT repeat protein